MAGKKILSEEERFTSTRLVAKDITNHIQNLLWEALSLELKDLTKGLGQTVIKIGDISTVAYDRGTMTRPFIVQGFKNTDNFKMGDDSGRMEGGLDIAFELLSKQAEL